MRNHLEDWLSWGDKSKRDWKPLVHFKETVSTTGRYFIFCACNSISLWCLCGGFWLPLCSIKQLAYFILASFVTVDAKRKKKASLRAESIWHVAINFKTSIAIFFVYFCCQAPMRPDSGHVTPCQDNRPALSSDKWGRSTDHCWPDFWACSVESRPSKVGHDDVPLCWEKCQLQHWSHLTSGYICILF